MVACCFKALLKNHLISKLNRKKIGWHGFFIFFQISNMRSSAGSLKRRDVVPIFDYFLAGTHRSYPKNKSPYNISFWS